MCRPVTTPCDIIGWVIKELPSNLYIAWEQRFLLFNNYFNINTVEICCRNKTFKYFSCHSFLCSPRVGSNTWRITVYLYVKGSTSKVRGTRTKSRGTINCTIWQIYQLKCISEVVCYWRCCNVNTEFTTCEVVIECFTWILNISFGTIHHTIFTYNLQSHFNLRLDVNTV